MLKTTYKIILYALWFPALVFIFNAIVWLFNVYEVWAYIDIPMHLFGGIAITYFFWKSILISEDTKLIPALPLSIKYLLTFTLTCTTTVFWEFAEYILDHTIANNVQLGLDDTLLDMLLGILGAVIFLGLKAISKQKKSNK